MFKNRLVNIMLIIIISITLIGVVALVLFNYFSSSTEAGSDPTIDEIIENSWETEEITTNLNGGQLFRGRFRIHVDSDEGASELEKRDFQVNNIIIHELAGMSANDIQTQDGINELETTLRSDIDEILDNGEVIRVYTTERMIQ
ncbi:flagellar basal body-associated protein FliL [Salibacterium salarium]|uniref:Flagellar protein FliL n=1 Tax=Salibacterium salarium TaxID=284579 RepID=A0A3R9RDP8_9BACI|nr:flagellar basal body-associated protein FliL [Salibacterium salarium]RSL33175.1 flagellar basal body-associated protein FliL [Salibacterium salarium]